jgi:ABC-type glycerol-3-phosphate transport system substrate-binding protein
MKRTSKIAALALGAILLLGACATQTAPQTDAPAQQAQPPAVGADTTSVPREREVIEFWFHSADDVSNPLYQGLIDEFNAMQDYVEVIYTGINFADFANRFTMAVATDTMPDVVSLGFSNMNMYQEMGAIIDIYDKFFAWEEHHVINPVLVQTAIEIGGGELLGIPYAYNQEVSWYYVPFFEEHGLRPPTTQDEFLEMAERFADPANDRYLFSLRGVRPYDNLVGWLFTHADGAGYGGSYFDENYVSIINRPEFVAAMDAYASLYWNNWVSGDSVNNNFGEMVAEFGAGTSVYIMHNSASFSQHMNNFGEGNFGAVRALTNNYGRYFTSGLQPNIYSILNTRGLDGNYDAAWELVKFLSGSEPVARVSAVMGRVPVNTESFNYPWAADSELLQLCLDIVSDPNFIQIQNPYWLPDFQFWVSDIQTTGFQAILLGDRTSQDVLDEWAGLLTTWQAEWMASR